MMKFTVTTDGRTLTAETVSILKAIHDIDDGEILTNAFGILLEVILDDKRES